MVHFRTGIFRLLGRPAIYLFVPHGAPQDPAQIIIRAALPHEISKAIFIVGIEAVPDTTVCRYADTITIATQAASVCGDNRHFTQMAGDAGNIVLRWCAGGFLQVGK